MRKPRLLWTLYPSYVFVTVAVVLAIGWYATASIESFYTRHVAQELEARAKLVRVEVEALLDSGDTARLDAACKTLGRESGTRITVVLRDGTVVADSEEDPAKMENHADRPEIRAACVDGIGSSVRYSATLEKNMMYLAVPVTALDGKPAAVVRTSLPMTEVMSAASELYVRILTAGVIVAVLAAVVSLGIARRITKPLSQMQQTAEAFAAGELAREIPPQGTREMNALALSLNDMARQLEERIRTVTEQRNELEALLASMTEAVLAVDREERLTHLNHAASRLFDVDPDDVKGRPLSAVVRNSELHRMVQQTLSDGDDDGAEREIVLVQGTREVFLQAHGTCLSDTTGDRRGVVVVLTDVTRLKKLENVRRDFVANVSHELRTPVTAIKGFLETLREGDLENPDDASRFLDIALKQVDRLNAILEDLLTLSRIEQSESEDIPRASQRIRDVLEGALLVCESKAADRNISVSIDCPEDLVASVNALLLEQAVVNLLDNAIKYSEPGDTVTVQATRDGNLVSVRVVDQGCGIPPEHLSRVFERFYRVDKARSRKLGGTGLGLAIVKHIIAAHGGSVSAESTPGKGSTFTLRFPGG